MKHKFLIVASVLAATQTVVLMSAQESLDIYRDKLARFIPVSLEGYNGEALSALKFDLEIQGFEVTSADKAQYLISGHNSASLVGRVTDRINNAALLAKEYTGGTSRTQPPA